MTRRFLCAVRLRLGGRAGETEERGGARGGAQGKAAIWQVQRADLERSARTAELWAPRAWPADIRAPRSRPPRQRPQIGGAPAPRGPASRALARALLSPPLGRAPRCRLALLRAEPGAVEARPGTHRRRGLRPCALGSWPGCLRPRSSARRQLQPHGSSPARGGQKTSQVPPRSPRGVCAAGRAPLRAVSWHLGPHSPLGGGLRDVVATRRRERRGRALGPNPRGRQNRGKAAGPTPPQGTRLRLNPGGAARGLAKWRGCAGGGRGASRCLRSGMLNRGAHLGEISFYHVASSASIGLLDPQPLVGNRNPWEFLLKILGR